MAALRLANIASHFTSSSQRLRLGPDDASSFPTRKNLPQIPGAPKGAAWVWGEDDQIGRLNLLTKSRVLSASKTIRTGKVVSLNLPLNQPSPPCFEREAFEHRIKPLSEEGTALDDVFSGNTQSGSQWDGFRHFAHLATKTFYNGHQPSQINHETPSSTPRNGIHNFGVLAGRAILLDYATYAANNSITYNVFAPSPISLSALKAVGRSQGIDIRPASQGGDIQPGDLLLIRSGFNVVDKALSQQEREKWHRRAHVLDAGEGPNPVDPEETNSFIGVEQSEEMVDWLHDCYFAAVAGDQPSFECWPTKGFGAGAQGKKERGAGEGGDGCKFLHEYLLALWGCPIGEFWDLEEVSRVCREEGRWSFFWTSAPMNLVGGVASPPNAVAIF